MSEYNPDNARLNAENAFWRVVQQGSRKGFDGIFDDIQPVCEAKSAYLIAWLNRRGAWHTKERRYLPVAPLPRHSEGHGAPDSDASSNKDKEL